MGKFITFEGGEGSGKTSIIKRLSADLEKDNYKFILSREPGGSKISEDIRKIILDKENTNMSYMTECLLYAASRAQHVNEVVKSALDNNINVISDRYIFASLAYQGYARGIGIKKVYDINMHAINNILPDLSIIIDVSPEVGLKRIISNNREMNRLDLENISFHEKVRQGYLEISKMFDNVIVVDGEKDFDVVYENIKKIVYSRL